MGVPRSPRTGGADVPLRRAGVRPRTGDPDLPLRRAAVLPLAALLLAACAGEPRPAPADAETADTTPAEAVIAAPRDSADPIVQRFRDAVPDTVFVRPGACPFECCMYREWSAESDIPVLTAVRGSPQFTIAPGQRFQADSGAVHITGVMVVAVEDSVGDPPYWSFARGDTLVVLDYVGEGRYNVWQGGRELQAEAFWGAGAPVGNATTYGRWEAEWWVHVTLPDGRRGWFLASPDVHFAGADACG